QEGMFFKDATTLPEVDYNTLLAYLQGTGETCQSVYTNIYNVQSTYLQPRVREHKEVHISGRTYSTSKAHLGNSAIHLHIPNSENTSTGFIEAIWSTILHSKERTFFIVRTHRRLSFFDEVKAPFMHFHPRYGVQIKDARPSDNLVIIEHRHVIAHTSTLRRPAGTYGIPHETLVVCTSLNRGRR
ncbi:hypothetical protein SCHPADRAFT_810421, partial [Schizopora paradoxa]